MVEFFAEFFYDQDLIELAVWRRLIDCSLAAMSIINNNGVLHDTPILEILEHPQVPRKIKNDVLASCEWVYVVGNRDEGKYKIGMTTRVPVERVNEFSPSLPFKTEIIFRCPTTNARFLEDSAHRCFSDKRTNGEWFELSNDDLENFEALSI